jgi:hypothetical protein
MTLWIQLNISIQHSDNFRLQLALPRKAPPRMRTAGHVKLNQKILRSTLY